MPGSPIAAVELRLDSQAKRIAELEDQVGVLVVVLIGTLVSLRSPSPAAPAAFKGLLDVLAPEERN